MSPDPASVQLVHAESCNQSLHSVLDDAMGQLELAAARDSDEESSGPIGCSSAAVGQLQRIDVDGERSIMELCTGRRLGTSGGVQHTPRVPDESSSDSSDSAPLAVLSSVAIPQPEVIGVTLEEHLVPGQRGHYRRLIAQCPLRRCKHAGTIACTKKRGVGQRQIEALGPRGPEAFLGAWAAAANNFSSQKAHVQWNPPIAQVRAFMVDRGWAVS